MKGRFSNVCRAVVIPDFDLDVGQIPHASPGGGKRRAYGTPDQMAQCGFGPGNPIAPRGYARRGQVPATPPRCLRATSAYLLRCPGNSKLLSMRYPDLRKREASVARRRRPVWPGRVLPVPGLYLRGARPSSPGARPTAAGGGAGQPWGQPCHNVHCALMAPSWRPPRGLARIRG